MLFTLKEKITKMLHSHLDYKFNCSICNYIYFGKSKRHFKVRTCGHLELTFIKSKIKPSNKHILLRALKDKKIYIHKSLISG